MRRRGWEWGWALYPGLWAEGGGGGPAVLRPGYWALSLFLSPQYRTATAVLSVSGTPGTDYWGYLRSVDALLAEFGARVHWGKLHFLTPERLHELYPRAGDFIALRRELDPEGVFLNEHLRPLFA